MSNEDETSSPSKHTLQYWHATERPAFPFLRLLAFAAGILISFFGVAILGGVCSILTLDRWSASRSHGNVFALVVAALWAGCTAASIVWLFIFLRWKRNLPAEFRRQPQRFFELGLLIGLGIATLFQGIYFGVTSI